MPMSEAELKEEVKKYITLEDGKVMANQTELGHLFVRFTDEFERFDKDCVTWNKVIVEVMQELRPQKEEGFRTSLAFFRGCPKCKGELDTRGYCSNSKCTEFPGICY